MSRHFWPSLSGTITDLIFPRICVGCGDLGQLWCGKCHQQLPPRLWQSCLVCRKPSLDGITHSHCATKYQADQLICLYEYQSPLLQAAWLPVKYHFAKTLGQEIAQLITTHPVFQNIPHNSCFTAIPLHRKRQNWRGYNQSQLIATALAHHCHGYYTELLCRTKATRVQKDLHGQARHDNVRHAFTIKTDMQIPENLYLIDDVVTTGSTMREAVSALKHAGVAHITCIALAQD